MNEDHDEREDDEDDGSTCRHNDHGHLLLWIALVCTMIGSCNGCNPEFAELRQRVDALEQRR